MFIVVFTLISFSSLILKGEIGLPSGLFPVGLPVKILKGFIVIFIAVFTLIFFKFVNS